MVENALAGRLRIVNAQVAQQLANRGYTVVAGSKNPIAGRSGHVATVRPVGWGQINPAIPEVSNVGGGQRNAIMRKRSVSLRIGILSAF